MADVVERLPYPFSKRLATAIEDVLAKNGREIHYTIGGVPFRLHATTDTPVQFQTAQVQKSQQDTEPEAGEQTLAGWWLRSQASWHQGAGYRYAETRGEVKESNFFLDSLNVDVWTQGSLSLLRKAVEVSSSSNQAIALVPDPSVLAVVAGRNGEVRRYTNLDVDGSSTVLVTVGGVNFNHVVATSTSWYSATDNGKVYSGPIGALTGAPSIWTLTGADVTKPTRIAWAKHRLFAINGNKVYQLDSATPGATAAAYSHPSTAWQYTDIADVPGGVLFSGYGDGTSHLQRIDLNTDVAVPVLSGATTTGILPSDERVLRVNALTGSLLCILTSRGVRVAQTQTSGELVYGPLFLERSSPLPLAGKPALASSGRFWWVSWGDSPMVYRVDSSVQPEEGVFAYATDMNLPSGTGFTGISARGDRPVVVTSSGALVYRHATQLETEGWIQSGRIRFRTEEPKLFQFVDVSAAPLQGVVSLDVLNEADSGKRIGQWTTPGMGALPTSQVPANTGPLRFMSLKLTLTRAGDGINGPEIHGWQVKALPAGKPQRLYQLPLNCYDRETWSTGQEDPYGYEGYAKERYYALRQAEDAGGVVMLRDYRFPSPQGELCKIEDMKFIQTSAGNPSKQQVFEGLLIVTLRTLT